MARGPCLTLPAAPGRLLRPCTASSQGSGLPPSGGAVPLALPIGAAGQANRLRPLGPQEGLSVTSSLLLPRGGPTEEGSHRLSDSPVAACS